MTPMGWVFAASAFLAIADTAVGDPAAAAVGAAAALYSAGRHALSRLESHLCCSRQS